MKFVRKSLIVEGKQWNGDLHAISEWASKVGASNVGTANMHETYLSYTVDQGLLIFSVDGVAKVDLMDWVLCDCDGELYSCAPDFFVEAYDQIPSQ